MWDEVPEGSALHSSAVKTEMELKSTEGYWGWMKFRGRRTQRCMDTRASAHRTTFPSFHQKRILGGVATIAAGAATLQIPVVAAGIALFGTAGMKLDLHKKKKKKPEEDREWVVSEHD
ncbi:hypothetical protein FOXB_13438 [Fusarium oxysporum f. sp. conglutinans Fo5176]|uniref:Uncharacterized protein n=1 Tax=Fusarium oxysporum (strain Fo5176) TaxID=660025 RepID=F9G456_FUSOF|nr:hypothetical protein FOXB_13438 [Fusarium oxysporum f. sp. conglutinans Fo5176]